MSEEEIVKLIKSKSKALEENLLLSTEVEPIKKVLNDFLDSNLNGDSLLSLRYRKFKIVRKSVGLWTDSNGFPHGGAMSYLQPWIEFFEKYITEKKIINRLEKENLWVETRTQGDEQHILVGEKDAQGNKVHVILGDTGEIRIDKKDQPPGELFKKVQAVLERPDGSVVKSTLEFFNEKV
jgi:hypothetical protein